MQDPLLLGIDVGTFGSKGVLCTPHGEVVAVHSVEHGLAVPQPGWAEQDADAVWWGDVCRLTHALLSQAGVTGEHVAAVGISALGPDLVALDAAGRPLRPAILYGVDTRATAETAVLEERYGAEALAELGGHFLNSQAVGPKILWLRRHEPEVFARTRYLCSASTFLILRLTGEYVLDHHTGALFNPLYDRQRLAWDAGMGAEIVGDIPLPRLVFSNEVVGTITPWAAEQTGLRAGTPVNGGNIDAVAEAVGVGVVQPGDLMMMFGTTTFFVLVLDRSLPPSRLVWNTPYILPRLHNLEFGTATTGAFTRWFRDNFAQRELAVQAAGGPEAYSVLTLEAGRVPPGSQGLVILPYLSGERSPLYDPDARGVLVGLSLAHGRGHLYRAVLEATAYAVAHNLEAMQAAGGVARRSVAVGGGARSELLLQIVSDVSGVEMALPEQIVGASYGDAFLAGLAIGWLDLAALRRDWVRIARHFAPDPVRHSTYQEYYAIYRELYPQTCAAMHRLARLARNGA
jgi:xylulokinase